jgi:diketogulonate reductase-like aldo/keto reductase
MKKEDRRSFIKQSALAATACLMPMEIKNKNQISKILHRTIPSTGEQIPAIGLGSWLTFDVGSSPSEMQPVKSVIKSFYEAGGRLIDSSPMYGRSEQAIGQAAAELGLTDKLWMITKVWTSGENQGKTQIENSKNLFKTWPKLLQVHNLQDMKTHLRTLRALKEAGRIKYIGLTHYVNSAHDQLAALIKSEKPDFIQVNLSIRNTAAEDYLIPLAADQGVGVIINRPLETGALFNAIGQAPLPPWAMEYNINTWAAYFLKYLVSNKNITCVIPATRRMDHVRENMEAGRGEMVDEKMRNKMKEYFKENSI